MNELMKSCEVEELGYEFTSLWALLGQQLPWGKFCNPGHFTGLERGEQLELLSLRGRLVDRQSTLRGGREGKGTFRDFESLAVFNHPQSWGGG